MKGRRHSPSRLYSYAVLTSILVTHLGRTRHHEENLRHGGITTLNLLREECREVIRVVVQKSLAVSGRPAAGFRATKNEFVPARTRR